MPNVIYRVQVSGVEQARAAIASVPGHATAAAESLSERTNRLADSFKMVSRDIGTLGGAASQTFTHMADEALSIVGVITGGGGLVAAISVAGIVIGRLAEAWKDYETSEKAAAKFSTEWLTKHNKQLEEALILQRKTTAALSGETRASAEEKILATTTKINELKTQIAKAEADSAYRVGKDKEDREKKLLDLNSQLYLFETDRNKAIQDRQKILDENTRKMRESFEIENAAAAELRRIQATADEIARKREANARSAEAAIEFDQRTQRLAQDREDEQTKRLAEQDAAENKAAEEREKRVDEAMAQDNDQFRQEKEHDNARLDALREYDQEYKRAMEEERKELERLRQEQIRASIGMAYANSVNASYAVGMYAVGKSVDFVSSELMQFQDINRDNWRDMLQITEDTKAAFAARLQAFLFSTAIEAGKMAIWENAEGIKETALGAGALFTNPAEAASHFVSAGLHYAASAAYGTFAGGAAVGAGVVASQRGEGGLFASAPSGGGGYGSGGAGGGGGPSGGSYSGGGERGGGGPVVINITNEPGSMPPDDQDRAAMAVARHVRRAQQDWFTSQEMGG